MFIRLASSGSPLRRPSLRPRRPRLEWPVAAAALLACGAQAQRLDQDALDLQGRSSVVQGSGARAFGMGGAFLARPDDATAASWNPAGLSYLRRPEVSLVLLGDSSLINREFGPLSADPTLFDRRAGGGFDFLAVTHPLSLGELSGAVQVSYQRLVPFDTQRNIERPSGVRRIHASGGFDVLAFATGLQVSRRLRLGVAVNRWFNGYDQLLDRQAAVSTLQTLRFDLAGSNVNLGAIWSPVDDLNLGLVVKMPFTAQVEMARTREDVAVVEGPRRDTLVRVRNSHTADDVRLHLPGALGVGVSWRSRSTLTLSADYTRSFWSGAYIRNFFTLAPCVPGAQCPPDRQPAATNDLFGTLKYPALGDGRQSDTEEIRFGIERVLIFEGAKLPVRAGFFSDRQYFLLPDQTPPRSVGWTAGIGVVVGPMLLDVAYVRESLRFANGEVDETAARRVSFVSERAYFSMIFRLP